MSLPYSLNSKYLNINDFTCFDLNSNLRYSNSSVFGKMKVQTSVGKNICTLLSDDREVKT